MRAETMWALMLTATVLLASGCATVPSPPGHGAVLRQEARSEPALGWTSAAGGEPAPASPRPHRRRGERADGMPLVVAGPAGLVLLGGGASAGRLDSFEALLALAGVAPLDEMPPEGAPLTPEEAARLLTLLLNKPVTLGTFPPRMAVAHMLREVLEEGRVSREELLRRVERFNLVAVLRPDGYLAWTRSGRTQQKAIGTLEWRDGAFRAGPLELGRFYVVKGQVFRLADERLRPVKDAEPLAEVYDDADYIGRTLDGAEDAFVALHHAMGQLLSYPTDSLLALKHLPEGMRPLLASSPEYLERLTYMTRGEQVRELSRLATHLVITWGAAAGTTRTVASALRGAEATVPVLSLSAQGTMAVERLVLPAGSVGTALSGGPGAAIILHRAHSSQTPAPASGPGQWGPARESLSDRSRRYQEQIIGHTADDAYWVGGMSTKDGGVKFDGFKKGVLQEAKGPGYANKFLDDLNPKSWFKHSGAKALVDQARRQLKAAKGVSIRWSIAEEKTADAIRYLFKRNDVAGIEVVHVPPL
jgi:hypothetical protein